MAAFHSIIYGRFWVITKAGGNGTENPLKESILGDAPRMGSLWDLPHFRWRVKLRLKHPKAVLALLADRNLPARTSAA
jgi:hypothetical protein